MQPAKGLLNDSWGGTAVLLYETYVRGRKIELDRDGSHARQIGRSLIEATLSEAATPVSHHQPAIPR